MALIDNVFQRNGGWLKIVANTHIYVHKYVRLKCDMWGLGSSASADIHPHKGVTFRLISVKYKCIYIQIHILLTMGALINVEGLINWLAFLNQ